MITGVLESKKIVSQVAIQPNTFIGGVAASIPDKATLASILNISTSDVTAFSIFNNDVAARIEVNYTLPDAANDSFFWRANNNLTYYRDEGGKVTYVGQNVFRYSNSITEAYFPNATSIGIGAFIQNGVIYDVIYIPRATTLGASVSGDETVLFGVNSTTSIYLDPSLQTANAGSEEGDVAAARAEGANIVYVQNFTKPSDISDLSIGTKFATAFQVNFTPPVSTNNILKYKVFDGFKFIAEIDASGKYVGDLIASTSYNIKVITYDIYYNSSVSNGITVTTNAIEDYPVGKLLLYLKTQDNTIDSFQTANGSATDITYDNGLVNRKAVFNGTTSFISIPDQNKFSFTDGLNDKPFSFGLILKLDVLTSTSQYWLLGKRNSSSVFEYQLSIYDGTVYYDIYDTTNNAYIRNTFPISLLNTTDDIVVTCTYNGNGLNGMETYLNENKVTGTRASVGTYACMKNTSAPLYYGKRPEGSFIDGSLEELFFFKTALTSPQVSSIVSKFQLGQSII